MTAILTNTHKIIGTSLFLNERHLKYQVQIKLEYCGTQLLNLSLPDVGSMCRP